ncbi:MAG TPA: hypothetical protein VD837_09450 [Terriglobales bacterium]|nr:hypothetical protein [Terriglobales bacterium]
MRSKHAFPAGSKWHTFSSRARLSPEQREREFLIGAPLAMAPAVFAIPVWLILVQAPPFRHALLVADVLYATFAIVLVVGTRKLVRCIRIRDLDLLSAMAFGILLVLCVMFVYACVFLFAVSRGFARL